MGSEENLHESRIPVESYHSVGVWRSIRAVFTKVVSRFRSTLIDNELSRIEHNGEESTVAEIRLEGGEALLHEIRGGGELRDPDRLLVRQGRVESRLLARQLIINGSDIGPETVAGGGAFGSE